MVAETNIPAVPEPQKGEYRKIQDLSSGGMGSVDLARVVAGPHAGRIVALKRLHPHLERERHFAEMFFDEAKITAGLQHPNVVEILDWGRDTQGHYLALEYVAGDSLLGLIREAKRANLPIPVGLALFIVAKTAEGLHAAHELRNEKGELRHLVHRDVTPSNILVGIDGSVKLIDFGVAKAKDKLSHTSTGTIKGKFGYMSPEQARGFPIDRRSDVFSLGIVLWEALALKRLYRSESELEILRMIVDDPAPPIRGIRNDVPESVETLLNAALAKNRDDRLGSCGEFADFLWAAYEEQGYNETEGALIEFFRRVMPERFNAVQQLLAGGSEFIEPTIARPASGSFSGLMQQDNMISGAVPRPMPPPVPTNGAVLGGAYTHPGAQSPMTAAGLMTDSGSVLPVVNQPAPPSGRRNALLIALGVVGVLAIVGTGVVISTHNNGPTANVATTPQPAAPVVAAPQTAAPTTNAAAPATPTPQVGTAAVAPSAGTAPSTTAAAPSTADTAASATAPSIHPVGGHHPHSGTHSQFTDEQVRNAMLNNAADNHPSSGSGAGSTGATHTTAAASSGEGSSHTGAGTNAGPHNSGGGGGGSETPPHTAPANPTPPAGGNGSGGTTHTAPSFNSLFHS